MYLCNRETDDGGGSASADGAAGADGDGTQICWYWVVEYRIAGILVGRTEELLFCEEAPDPGGEQASLTLDCGVSGPDDEPPERGEERNCVASLEGRAQDTSAVLFEWKSDHAAWSDSSDTGSSWGGVATDSTEITVTVVISDGEDTDTLSESETVPVTARTWEFQQVFAPWVFDSTISSQGLYDLPMTPSTVPSALEGGGPWAGRFYMSARPSADPVIKIHSDYSDSGPAYAGARATCAAAASTVAASASYYEVNDSTACNRLAAMDAWRATILAHEREHEAGVNACLSSGAARTALDAIEGLVYDSETRVTGEAQNKWSDFYTKSLNKSGYRASGVARNSGSHFWHYYGGWRLGTPGIKDESRKQHSC